jgi:serine/threonine protein kinase
MISDSPAFFYTLLSPEYFESLDRYTPSREYIAIVEEHTGDDWEIRSHGFWTQCTPKGVHAGPQGWKIHLSATPLTGEEVLRRVVPIFAGANVSFKLCSDRRMLRLSTGKNWPRTGSGKFITVYPDDAEQFKLLIDQCHAATTDLRGPFILSDRPYKDSKVVFYRYGEHRGTPRVSPSGDRLAAVVAPNGEVVSDERKPYFSLPPWVTDPFSSAGPLENPGSDGILLKDRYRVLSAERYSSIGGIYGAEDTLTGQLVIIREARPMVSTRADGFDALGVLQKEARILRRLGPTGYLPQFIDLFQEWEHLFLVQERLQADSLWGYAINITSDGPDRTAGEVFDRIRETIRTLITGLQVVHEHQVVLRDLTKSNVMFTKDGQVKFIDFELSYEMDGDEPPIIGFTPGYASPDQLATQRPTPAEDYYALGALILDMIAFTVAGYPLNRAGILESLSLTLSDLGLPQVLRDIVVGLTDPDPVARWRPDRVLKALDEGHVAVRAHQIFAPGPEVPKQPTPAPELRSEIETTLGGVTSYIQSKAEYSRRDRLWPASGEVFRTNPISIQFGAAGVAYYLLRATGEVPETVVDWILAHRRVRPCPPGLYIGLSGVALLLLDIGREQEAKEMLAASDQPDLIREVPGLYYGAAGWGLANLHFWRKTGEQVYLDRASEIGEHLARTAKIDGDGASWESNGIVALGFGHGQSGIATFLAYLNAARPDERVLSLAAAAMDFELAQRQELGNKLLWFAQTHARLSGPKSPHMRYGTAGIGSALLRVHAVTGEPRLRHFAEMCGYSVALRFTNKIWQDYGIAGYCEYLLDMYTFLGDENYLNNAYYVAEALLPYRLFKPEGIAFPGSELLRISCDYGLGSAGIGMFLHRLLNPQVARFLMLDEMLLAGGRAQPVELVQASRGREVKAA